MPDGSGNAAQTRVIAEQVGEAAATLAIARFVAAHPELAPREPKKWGASAPAWIGCIFAAGTFIWSAGFMSGDVAEQRRRIEALEIKQEQSVTDRGQVIDRLARIEAKLDLMGGDK